MVFDLARDIDAHKLSTAQSGEHVIAGRDAGLMELGETVTWRAKHFGVWQNMTVRMTELVRPEFFADEMEKGAFARMRHVHRFTEEAGVTTMTDEFDFRSPLGPLGWLADTLFLRQYMTRFLRARAEELRRMAEG